LVSWLGLVLRDAAARVDPPVSDVSTPETLRLSVVPPTGSTFGEAEGHSTTPSSPLDAM
jgi:hypothetical protein